jgi:hypothetical protein
MIFNRIGNFFTALLSTFRGNSKLHNSLTYVEDLIPNVGPFIKIAGDIIVGIIPGNVDDATWSFIKAKYPQLFDGSKQDKDLLKLYALGIATDLIQKRFPDVSTTVSRAAAQLSYLVQNSK